MTSIEQLVEQVTRRVLTPDQYREAINCAAEVKEAAEAKKAAEAAEQES